MAKPHRILSSSRIDDCDKRCNWVSLQEPARRPDQQLASGAVLGGSIDALIWREDNQG